MLSRIGNSIIATNQRRMFETLLHQNLEFFASRHSSEFLARLSTGAISASQVLNLVINAIGRDLLVLIGLLVVMVVQDPVMSFFALAIAPPAVLLMRKLIRRITATASSPAARASSKTMQETVQGIRIVKAFTLEDAMRARFDANVAEVERESNKMARVGPAHRPADGALGGVAIALAMIYGGYRVIETGATPGEFFSFLAVPARL